MAKYIELTEPAEINGRTQDPSIGVLYLSDEVADALIEDGKAVELTDQFPPRDDL